MPNNSSAFHLTVGRFQGKSASVYRVQTHTARQHNREADKAPDTKTKAAGFYTRRSRDGEMNKRIATRRRKEDQDLGWIRAQARPPCFFLSPHGRNKEARRRMDEHGEQEINQPPCLRSLAPQEARSWQRAPRNLGTRWHAASDCVGKAE